MHDYEVLNELSKLMVGMVAFLMIIVVITIALGIIAYIFTSLSLYKIAQNRRIPNPWMAWIPIVNGYLLGNIADDINAYSNKNSNYKIILLVTNIITSGVGGIMFAVISTTLNDGSHFTLILRLILLAQTIIQLFALYIIFKDYKPNSAVVYLILCIFIPISLPFILYSLRNKPSISMSYAYYNNNQNPYGYNQQNYPQQNYNYNNQNQQYYQNNYNTQNYNNQNYNTQNYNNQNYYPQPQQYSGYSSSEYNNQNQSNYNNNYYAPQPQQQNNLNNQNNFDVNNNIQSPDLSSNDNNNSVNQ